MEDDEDFLPAALIVAVLSTSRSSKSDDLFANLSEIMVECQRENQWRDAWASLTDIEAYGSRISRIRRREDIQKQEMEGDDRAHHIFHPAAALHTTETVDILFNDLGE